MRKFLLYLIILFFFSSCNKNYKYIESIEKESLFGEIEKKQGESKIIKAKTDSIAYLKAYKKFVISLKTYDVMMQSIGSASEKPLSFKLINDKGQDITNTILLQNKDSLEQDIHTKIFSLDNSISGNSNLGLNNNSQKVIEIDSSKVEELTPFFRVNEDEFDPNSKTIYKPKSAPLYVNKNGLYVYFIMIDNKPRSLRFRLQYLADEWLFIRKVQFSIDEKAYEFIPRNVKNDNGSGQIWEWFDEGITTESDLELLNAIANGKSVRMKILGRHYYEKKTINEQQKKDIQRTIELYRALGGSL